MAKAVGEVGGIAITYTHVKFTPAALSNTVLHNFQLKLGDFCRLAALGLQGKMLHLRRRQKLAAWTSVARYFPFSRTVLYMVAICPCMDELITEPNPIQSICMLLFS